MKQCARCGTMMEDSANFCGSCGSAEFAAGTGNKTAGVYGNVPDGSGIPVPNYQPYPFAFQNVPPDVDRSAVSKSEFLKKYADPALRKEWRSIGIFFYIASGLSILLAMFMSSIFEVFFCILLLGLVLGTHLAVNKVCAIILLVLSCLDTLLCLIAYGTPGGWLWILVGAMAVTKIGKINTQYKQFQCGMPF